MKWAVKKIRQDWVKLLLFYLSVLGWNTVCECVCVCVCLRVYVNTELCSSSSVVYGGFWYYMMWDGGLLLSIAIHTLLFEDAAAAAVTYCSFVFFSKEPMKASQGWCFCCCRRRRQGCGCAPRTKLQLPENSLLPFSPKLFESTKTFLFSCFHTNSHSSLQQYPPPCWRLSFYQVCTKSKKAFSSKQS